MNRIINMIIRQLTRKLVNKGVDAGIGAATRKQKPVVDDHGNVVQSRPQKNQGKKAARQARQSMKMARRMSKF